MGLGLILLIVGVGFVLAIVGAILIDAGSPMVEGARHLVARPTPRVDREGYLIDDEGGRHGDGD